MLLRHAKADSPQGIDDHSRPLARRGRIESAAMGKYMAGQGLAPDLAIVSTARRAQETWRLAQPAFAADTVRRDDGRLYGASAQEMLAIIQESPASAHVLLLVGHNPGLQQLAAGLIATGRPSAVSRLQREYPTAGLAVIDFAAADWRQVSPRSGHLERFETPES
ncbi:phosphohistidine phosphatase [Pollutimonas bauzanensis]|uniref:Phosphohistidine phosphatase n=2 Tax=Pollutimonas bauzanensis TaxID=658167 RepID=A0A1M5ZXP6_9BURK|nr:phosphohistidine phosphatase [Pollutimonas bauzanensis]